MGNFFGDIYNKLEDRFGFVPADPIPMYYGREERKDDEEERKKKDEEEKRRLQDILQGKIDAESRARDMPTLTSGDTRLATRRAKASLLARGGRGSTFLSGDPLGGGF